MGLKEQWGPTIKEAGTFSYPGDTVLDMTYGMSDLLAQIKRRVSDPRAIHRESVAVSKALFKLEEAVKKVM